MTRRWISQVQESSNTCGCVYTLSSDSLQKWPMSQQIVMEFHQRSLEMGCTSKRLCLISCILHYVHTIYRCVECICSVSFQIFQQLLLIPFTFGLHMQNSLKLYIDYVDGASRSIQNLSSATWAIFAPNGKLVSMQGIFISLSTNNIAEYNAVVELIYDDILYGIRFLVIKLDSKLVVLQIANVYLVRNTAILCMVLRVCILERYFDFI